MLDRNTLTSVSQPENLRYIGKIKKLNNIGGIQLKAVAELDTTNLKILPE
jgi:hypothetical protein